MYRICKRFTFEAAHRLFDESLNDEENRERFGKCFYMHGHSYKIYIFLKGLNLKEDGMLMDLNKLKEIVEQEIIKIYDHSYLNDFFSNSNNRKFS